MSYQCQRPCENKTGYGYCKTSYCINPQFSNLGTWQETIIQHGTLTLKQQTNADRIRAMSDKEMAEWLGLKVSACNESEKCKNDYTCDACWLEWLRKEVET